MRLIKNTSARTALGKAIAERLPPSWQLIEHEAAADDSDRTRVRITQRSIAHSDTGVAGAHLVTFRVVVTVPTEALETAEADLDDELNLFLFALDSADVPWDTATKGRYGDENSRLGYQFDITIRTNPSEE